MMSSCACVVLEGSYKRLDLLFNLEALLSHDVISVQVGQDQVKGNCCGVICKTVGAIRELQGGHEVGSVVLKRPTRH